MAKILIVAVLTAIGALAQQTPPTNKPEVSLLFYDSSGNTTYICYANQKKVAATSVQISDSSLTNIVVASNLATVTTASASGLYQQARVTVSGSATTALNGTYTVSPATSNTYTFVTSGVSDGTYTDAALKITTTNPLTTEKLWAIQVLSYDGSSRLTVKQWGNSNIAYNLACTDRTIY
jgi:hypothetical protein